MNNKQLYVISNQQRFTLNSWKVIVPYSHVHFPVYLTNPYQLSYRRAGYIRGNSYNSSIGQQMFTFDMGVHLNPTLPNVGLYNTETTLKWSQWWTTYPSMSTKVIYEGTYTNCNLPYLPISKYHQYNNSGNRVFYDLIMHTLNRRYHNNSPRSYVTSGVDTIVSTYNPLTATILSNPSCIYYLLSPQRYYTLTLTHRGQIKTPVIYLRSLLHEYVYTHVWSISFARLWDKLLYVHNNTYSHLTLLTTLRGLHFATTTKVDSYLKHRYLSTMYNYPSYNHSISTTRALHLTLGNSGNLRLPVTQSLNFISSLQVSIPKKRLWGMGSWGINYLEYYTPRATAVMHGTGITSKLPMNKYARVTAQGQGGRKLSSRLYKGLLLLPQTLLASPICHAKILHFMVPYSYYSGYEINQSNYQVYTGAGEHWATKVKTSTLLSMWTSVWVKLYNQAMVRYSYIKITHKYPRHSGKGKWSGVSRKQRLPHMHRLWYNRMLPKQKHKAT